MSRIYFNDAGVFDAGSGLIVVSVYGVDTDQALPVSKISLPPSAAFGPQAVSFDGLLYAQARDLGGSSEMSLLDFETGLQQAIPYNATGGQSVGAGFAADGKLIVGSSNSIAIIAPPYLSASERGLPVTAEAFFANPSGETVLLLQSPGTAYICDVATLALSSPINLLQDGADGALIASISFSPDRSKFLASLFYGSVSAIGMFDAATGAYLGKTGNVTPGTYGYFLADSNHVLCKDSSQVALAVFDLATNTSTLVPLSGLDNDPVGTPGYQYSLRGATSDGYAIMDYYGYLRRVMLADGSVGTTPRTSIQAVGSTTVQPITASAGGQVLRYFWTDFLRSYENPVVVSG